MTFVEIIAGRPDTVDLGYLTRSIKHRLDSKGIKGRATILEFAKIETTPMNEFFRVMYRVG